MTIFLNFTIKFKVNAKNSPVIQLDFLKVKITLILLIRNFNHSFALNIFEVQYLIILEVMKIKTIGQDFVSVQYGEGRGQKFLTKLYFLLCTYDLFPSLFMHIQCSYKIMHFVKKITIRQTTFHINKKSIIVGTFI